MSPSILKLIFSTLGEVILILLSLNLISYFNLSWPNIISLKIWNFLLLFLKIFLISIFGLYKLILLIIIFGLSYCLLHSDLKSMPKTSPSIIKFLNLNLLFIF